MKSRGGGSDIDLGLGIIDDEVIIGLAEVDSGQCGDNAYYKLYSNGTLDISGTGALWAKSQIAWDSTKVVDVLVGEGITSLSTELFRGYTNIRDVHLPSTLTFLGTGAFRKSTLQSINIPEGVREIPSYCFSGCQLPEIVLPSTVTAINAYALNASALRSVTILATTPPGGGGQSSTTAFSTASTIYVPYDSLNAYKTSRWYRYADQFQPIVTISDVLRFGGEGNGDDISDFVDDRSDIVGLRIYGTENGMGYTAGDNIYVPIGQWTQTQPHAGQPGQWILTETDFAIIPEVLYEDDYADVWELCSSPMGTGATAITGSSLGVQLSGGSTYSLICKGTTNEQSTRTLAADPMTRSTLSTISDTPNIEDD